MIDQFSAKTKGKTLYIKVKGITTYIGEHQEGKKPKLIDIAVGNSRQIIANLKSQGFMLKFL